MLPIICYLFKDVYYVYSYVPFLLYPVIHSVLSLTGGWFVAFIFFFTGYVLHVYSYFVHMYFLGRVSAPLYVNA